MTLKSVAGVYIMLWDFEFSMSAYLSGHILGLFFSFRGSYDAVIEASPGITNGIGRILVLPVVATFTG